MIVDSDGKEVRPLKCLKYSNVVTAQRIDNGNEYNYDIRDLRSTVSRKEFIDAIRKIQANA